MNPGLAGSATPESTASGHPGFEAGLCDMSDHSDTSVRPLHAGGLWDGVAQLPWAFSRGGTCFVHQGAWE